jgi:uncharacterized protein (TIGR04255 family)
MRPAGPCYPVLVDGELTRRGEGYPRPPIVEAVIERRFATPVDFDLVSELRKKFGREFPAVDQTAEFYFAFGSEGVQPQLRQTPVGYRLVHKAGTDIVVLTTQAIAYSRLAPYPGWTAFCARASEVFAVAHGVTGYVPLGRIGVRYVNRLDIRREKEDDLSTPLRVEDYMLVYAQYPRDVISARGFTLQCVFDLPDAACIGTINVGSVPSPLPGHESFVFDIDIGRNSDVPQNERDIRELMDTIRSEKNRIFESCLTDRMKDHFR